MYRGEKHLCELHKFDQGQYIRKRAVSRNGLIDYPDTVDTFKSKQNAHYLKLVNKFIFAYMPTSSLVNLPSWSL